MINTAISIDSKLLNDPSLLNLDKNIFKQDWLKVFTNANQFRNYVRQHDGSLELWILSNDDIEAINLAAAIKKDRMDCIVCLVCFAITGSLQSRAKAANIDTVINLESLKERIDAITKRELSEKKILTTSDSSMHASDTFELSKVPQELKKDSFSNKAFIVSILSASGGSGKSSVSVMASVLLKTAGFKTLIIDADFQFGDIANMLGMDKILHIDELIRDFNKVSELSRKDNMPGLVAAPLYPEYAEKIIEAFPELLDRLSSLFDVIVINTGSFWGEQQAVLLEKSSKSLFLIDQRASSINATKRAINLCERCGIAIGSVLFAINKCSKQALFSSIDVSCALKGSNVAEIMDGGIDVDEFLTTTSPLDLIKSKNSFAVSLWSILENIIPNNVMQKSSINLKKDSKVKKSQKNKSFFKRSRA